MKITFQFEYYQLKKALLNLNYIKKGILSGLVFGFLTSMYAQKTDKKIISANPEQTYQTFDGFGDCSLWQPLINTYNNFNSTNPAKLDEIADMLFTNKDPDKSFNFRFHHQVDIMASIDQTTNDYIPKSVKDNTDRYWFAQKLAERGGKISFRQSIVPSLWSQVIENGEEVSRNTDVPLFMSIMANTVKNVQNEYGFTFSDYTPMNESTSPWIPPSRPIGANCHLTNQETVTFIKEARTAFDAEGLNNIELGAFDALYLGNYNRLNNMLNSDAAGLLGYLSYHEYQRNENFMEYWYEKAIENNLKLRQSEWGDWKNLASSEEHAQAKNYATYIFRALSRGKVSVWLAWELQFIFNITNQGWAPKEAAWMMAQFSRFADPGMQMVQVNGMGLNEGTLAFADPGVGERDLSFITYNETANTVEYIYDLNSLENVTLKDIRLTSEFDNFKKLNHTIDAKNRLYITVPAESMLSIRVGFNGFNDPGTLISQNGWSLVSVSSAQDASTAGEKAFDGDPNTIWHTNYNGSDAFPNHIVIDLGEEYLLNSFSYLPRGGTTANSLNGITADYDLFLSQDAINWGSPVSSGKFSKDHDLKKITFHPTYGRYVRFVPKSSVNGKTFSSAAEFYLYQVDKPIVAPTANFELSRTTIYESESITFKDFSTGLPNERLWTIDKGSSVETYTDEVFSTIYTEPGVFNVKLFVKNENGENELLMENMVTVLEDNEAPEKPTEVPAIAVYYDAVLIWKPSVDTLSDVSYNIYLDGVLQNQVTTPKYMFNNLNNNQNYVFGVEAVDVSNNVSERTNFNFTTKEYIENQWVQVPVENHSFELPNDNLQHQLVSEIPNWFDDMEETNGAGSNVHNNAPDGNKIGVLSSHLGGTIYQPLADIVVENNTEYKLTYNIRASFFNNTNTDGDFKIMLAGYNLNSSQTSRTEIASTLLNIQRTETSFIEHQASFTIPENSNDVNKLLVLEFDLLNLSGSNWIQFDNIRLEKRINNTLGTDDLNLLDVNIYPNPVVSGHYISIRGVSSRAKTEVYNLSGQKIFSFKLQDGILDFGDLSGGLYILKIYDNDKLVIKKLVIK